MLFNPMQPIAAQERVWAGKLANVTKSQIFKDGSATFAGKLTVNNQAEILQDRSSRRIYAGQCTVEL